MRVEHLSLQNFRNYSHAEVSFAPGINVISGRNGQGKTNLVEAIGYFSRLGSHRVANDHALIRAGAASAVARIRVSARDRAVQLEIELARERSKRAQINGNQVSPRELPRWFGSVLFAPEDLVMIRGEPVSRRAFLDEALELRNPAASGVLADYDRVVRQRTALLKSARQPGVSARLTDTLEIWDSRLIELGSWIMAARRVLVRDLAGPLRDAYHSLVEEDHRPQLSLQESSFRVGANSVSRETPGGTEFSHPEELDVSRETIASGMHTALHSIRAREIERGQTLLGPHRDDLLLRLNDLPVKGFGSHGESWSMALSLRLAVATLLREESISGDPVIILDDVLAELDRLRRRSLMRAVSEFEQVIITAAVQEDVPALEQSTHIWVDHGTVREAQFDGSD